ncbi:hypothetical protein RXV86_08080 [Alisedimentitalea sp. MJ-SS2]|uniref:hypothetical protein n=1 Tax=Aliisedimentitalea sp. MJ-SS2 TaxID=3049795 RepID=UPI002912EDC7|nr:hypothetical protein [Alisedimentitalea sp. MJ-SS2]MDU8927340.1 hypothetical protein [Alisedimentitalea sp. MJ-SS2]
MTDLIQRRCFFMTALLPLAARYCVVSNLPGVWGDVLTFWKTPDFFLGLSRWKWGMGITGVKPREIRGIFPFGGQSDRFGGIVSRKNGASPGRILTIILP